MLHQGGGYERRTATIVGTVLSEALFLGVEFRDGFYVRVLVLATSTFNTLGAALAFAQSTWPRLDELVDFRVQYFPSTGYRPSSRAATSTSPRTTRARPTCSRSTWARSTSCATRAGAGGRGSSIVAVGFETRGYKPDPPYAIDPEDPARQDYPHRQTMFLGVTLNAQGVFDWLLDRRPRARKVGARRVRGVQPALHDPPGRSSGPSARCGPTAIGRSLKLFAARRVSEGHADLARGRPGAVRVPCPPLRSGATSSTTASTPTPARRSGDPGRRGPAREVYAVGEYHPTRSAVARTSPLARFTDEIIELLEPRAQHLVSRRGSTAPAAAPPARRSASRSRRRSGDRAGTADRDRGADPGESEAERSSDARAADDVHRAAARCSIRAGRVDFLRLLELVTEKLRDDGARAGRAGRAT